MQLLLIRHLESIKNTDKAFSSTSDDEPLTENGRIQARALGNSIREWSLEKGLTVNRIYASQSLRAVSSAELIGFPLGVSTEGFQDLRSTKPGELAGATEQQARQSNPEFMEQLDLYRKGVFCSYKFNVAKGKEDKRCFEKRIAVAIDEILEREGESLKVVVSHRSPITASLIRFARLYYDYPQDFFGYIPLDLGGISWLEFTAEGCKFHKINSSPKEFFGDASFSA